MSLKLAIQRLVMLALGGSGLIWGFFVLPTSDLSDDLRYIEAQLLRPRPSTAKRWPSSFPIRLQNNKRLRQLLSNGVAADGDAFDPSRFEGRGCR